jgi:hypothetical protein
MANLSNIGGKFKLRSDNYKTIYVKNEYHNVCGHENVNCSHVSRDLKEGDILAIDGFFIGIALEDIPIDGYGVMLVEADKLIVPFPSSHLRFAGTPVTYDFENDVFVDINIDKNKYICGMLLERIVEGDTKALISFHPYRYVDMDLYQR